jgi:hypothetical protein
MNPGLAYAGTSIPMPRRSHSCSIWKTNAIGDAERAIFVFSLMAQLLGRFSVGAGGRIPHPVDTASEPARQPSHATSRRATLGLYPGECGVRFDPYVGGVGGRLFLAMLGINDFARRLGLSSLFADLCKQVIKRGERRLVIE